MASNKRRGMSLNVARAMGIVASRPIIVDSRDELPCQPPYKLFAYAGGLSPKDEYLLAKRSNHIKALHSEFRL